MMIIELLLQVICLMKANGVVTQNFSAMSPNSTKCFTHLRPLSYMLLSATMTSAFTTCMMTCTARSIKQSVKLLLEN